MRTRSRIRKAVSDVSRWVALSVLMVFWSVPSWAASVISETYNPVLWGPSALPTQFVEYSADVSSSGLSLEYLNVVRDDGAWVVQNMLVGYEPGSHTTSTSINAALLTPGSSFQTTLGSTLLTAPPTYVAGSAISISSAITQQGNNPNGVTDFGALGGPPVAANLGFTFGASTGFDYHVGVPDLAQGVNQCVPTSSANSLTWLDNTFSLGINMTTSDIRDQLVTLMNTSAATGTTLNGFFTGKDAFATKYGIVTHAITGRTDGGPTLDNILAEMSKGQDVELGIRFQGGGGHFVTLVGILDLGALGAGIAFNDPDDGITGTAVSWLGTDGTFLYGQYAGSKLEFAAAESVPEPGSLTLIGLGLAGSIGAWGYRRRSGHPV